MQPAQKQFITVRAKIHVPLESVWQRWTGAEHVVEWNHASEDWHSPRAENDLREGGRFLYRMEARDGSTGFDFSGRYTRVEKYQEINYTLDDDRTVKINFSQSDGGTEIVEVFEAEHTNPEEMQRQGWQAILDNFKKYCESLS